MAQPRGEFEVKGMNHHSRGRVRARSRALGRRGTLIAAVAVASMFVAIIPTGASSFTGAVANSANSFSSGTLQLEGTTPTSVNCYSTGTGAGGTIGTNSNQCVGDLYTTALLSTTAQTATSTLTSKGTLGATGGTVAMTSCGVQQVVDSSPASDTGLAYGGVTYGGAFTSSTQATFTDGAVALNGVAASTYIGTVASAAVPTTAFTLTAWIKTSTATGGVIMGMSNVQNNGTPTSFDRMLFVNSTGHVVFNMDSSTGTKEQVTSTATVTNGAWHFIVATFSPTAGVGTSLYVDGVVATNTAYTTANTYTGYWHLGWNYATGWTGAPTSAAFNGSLYGLSVLSTSISAANVTTLYNETSSANYSSALSGYGESHFWPLNDTGTVPYTGSIPALGAAACPSVQVSIQETRSASSTCIYPTGGAACATWAALSAFTSAPLALPPTTAASTSIVVSMKVTAAPVAGAIYLHVMPTITFTTSLGSWSATLSYYSGSVQL